MKEKQITQFQSLLLYLFQMENGAAIVLKNENTGQFELLIPISVLAVE